MKEKEASQFDKELEEYAKGKLLETHVFNLGKPDTILQGCGFPKNHNIELLASRLNTKANQKNHPFNVLDIIGLDKALQDPIAVFEYGDKEKAQNVIVNIQKGDKNFLVGVHFNQTQRGYEVSNIRGLFPKDNIEWLRWIEQGKMIYGNKKEIQVLATQQRINFADVSNKVARRPSDEHYLDSVDNILQSFGNVNQIFTKNYPSYIIDQKTQYEIFKRFRTAYLQVESIDTEYAATNAHEFYVALKTNDKKTIHAYTDTDNELSESAKEIYEEYQTTNQIVYIDKKVSRVASLILSNRGNHVRLKDNNVLVVNKEYTRHDKKSSEISRSDKVIYSSFLATLKDEKLKATNKSIAINDIAKKVMPRFPLTEQIRISKMLTDRGVTNKATLAQILTKDVGRMGKKRERAKERER